MGTNRLALASLLEISTRDAIADECAHRSEIFKTLVTGDSTRIFTSGSMENIRERSLRKIVTNTSNTSTTATNYFLGFSEEVAEYLTVLNTLAKSMSTNNTNNINRQTDVDVNQDPELIYHKVLALVGFAYGRLISITGNKSALASENGTMNYHQAAHVAALQSVDVATTDWSIFLTNACPVASRNRDATAILEYLEHRRLECASKLNHAIATANQKWSLFKNQEMQRKHNVCILNEPIKSVWYDVGKVIVRDIWQVLYVHLENLLTVGTNKYQTLNDATIWNINKNIVPKVVVQKINLKSNQEKKRKKKVKIKIETKNEGKEGDEGKESNQNTESKTDNEGTEPTTPPSSPRSKQRLAQLLDLNIHVNEMSLKIDQVAEAIEYERTASTKYAEHDALLQLPDVSFIPARKG